MVREAGDVQFSDGRKIRFEFESGNSRFFLGVPELEKIFRDVAKTIRIKSDLRSDFINNGLEVHSYEGFGKNTKDFAKLRNYWFAVAREYLGVDKK